jgi:hypothetical protein
MMLTEFVCHHHKSESSPFWFTISRAHVLVKHCNSCKSFLVVYFAFIIIRILHMQHNIGLHEHKIYRFFTTFLQRRSQWPRGLRRRSAAARLLGLWVRIPRGVWKFVCCKYCVLSDRGLCHWLITYPAKSYRLWYVVVCDLEISWIRRRWPTGCCRAEN